MKSNEPIWRRYLRFWGEDPRKDVEDELDFHIEMKAGALMRAGVPEAEARRRAREEFGDVARARMECEAIDEASSRRHRRWALLDAVGQDLRYGARLLMRGPGFTMAAVLTLALGIGANTAIFSVVDQALLRPLPYPGGDRIVGIHIAAAADGTGPLSGPEFLDLREESRSFERLAAASGRAVTVTGGGDPERLDAMSVSPEFFETFGTDPVLGRSFVEAEAGERLAVLAGGVWRRRFGMDAAVLGSAISLDGEPYTVVGVMPVGFSPIQETDIWTLQRGQVPESPFAAEDSLEQSRGARYLTVVGRLRAGLEPAAARAELTAIQRRWAAEYSSEGREWVLRMVGWREELVGDGRRPLLVLLAAVGLVLLIACANLANLMLARSASRRREITVRAAIGAGPGRLLRQFLTESLLLSTIGAAVGVALAYLLLEPVQSLRPGGTNQLGPVTLDPRVLAFTLLLTTLAGVLLGLAPALEARRADLAGTLRGGGRSATGGMDRRRLQSTLVAAQVALSLVLLIGAGLLVRSLLRLAAVDPGFETERAVAIGLPLPQSEYGAERQRAFWQELLERTRGIPAVEAAGAAFPLPLSGSEGSAGILLEGGAPAGEETLRAGISWATDGFFAGMGIPLLRGRDFSNQDVDGSIPTIVVNETMAVRFWPGDEAVGKRIHIGEDPGDDTAQWLTVVGVVGDVRPQGLQVAPEPHFYLPQGQNPWPSLSLVVRLRGDAEPVVQAIRHAVGEIDPNLPLGEVRPLRTFVDGALADSRSRTVLVSSFAALALLLASVGIYGVVSFTVAQRTKEIGIRVALGAQPGDVVRRFALRGLKPVWIGIALGLLAAVAAGRVMRSLLFDVPATDAVTYLAVPVAIALVAGVAVLLPARRATRVEPMEALRGD